MGDQSEKIEKGVYLSLILPLSAIGIIAVIIMMLRYKYIFKDATIMLLGRELYFN